MQRSKYAPEFKVEAVKQVIDKGHSVVDEAKRLGIPDNMLNKRVSNFKKAGHRCTLLPKNNFGNPWGRLQMPRVSRIQKGSRSVALGFLPR